MSVVSRFTAASLLLCVLPAFASARPRHAKSTSATVRHASAHKAHFSAPGMPSERATAIQQALIDKGYLTGEPSGTWDSQSIAAMQKLQADNGWQTKYTPDSRALIKLGLGGTGSTTTLAEAQ